MRTIKFAKDYPKLQDSFFSTIRMPPKNMRTGEVVLISSPTSEFKAILIKKHTEKLSSIHTLELTKDTDTNSRDEAVEVLRDFYPDMEDDNDVQVLWFVHDNREE